MEKMTLAYLISAHTDAPQLKRLVDALNQDAHFFIHIDKKTDITKFTSIIQGENIHFLDNRVDVRWGTILEVEYQMNLIAAAIDYPKHFDRLITLSGMDYPLWSNKRIHQYFREIGDKEILTGCDLASPDVSPKHTAIYRLARPFFALSCFGNKGNQRLSIACRKVLGALGVKKSLTLPNGWHLYKGAAWWAISEDLGSYIFNTYRENAEAREYFRNSFGQAETFIQTIAFNSPKWAAKCMLTKGDYPGLAALTPLQFIIYEPVIKIMNETDYETLMASGKMFTRKLISLESDKLVQRLETRE